MKNHWKESPEKPRSDRWFDLCFLDVGEKLVMGWWTGTIWDGIRYKGEEVKRWKFSGQMNEQ